MQQPVLYIFSGLPGAGKTTVAKELTRTTQAAYLRLDTIEQGIQDLCKYRVQGEGYRLAYRIAGDNLALGQSVIADSCNPWKMTREEWESVALSHNALFVNIEIMCSDQHEHRLRIETRKTDIKNLHLPTWQDVFKREYHPWKQEHIIIDTAHKSLHDSRIELENKLKVYFEN